MYILNSKKLIPSPLPAGNCLAYIPWNIIQYANLYILFYINWQKYYIIIFQLILIGVCFLGLCYARLFWYWRKKNYGSNNRSIKLPITCSSQMNISTTTCCLRQSSMLYFTQKAHSLIVFLFVQSWSWWRLYMTLTWANVPILWL